MSSPTGALSGGPEAAAERPRVKLGLIVAVAGIMLVLATVLRDALPVGEYYYLLSTPFIRYSDKIGALADSSRWPLLAALLFGLLGTLAPCQLSSNLAAVTYASKAVGRPLAVVGTVLAYVAGKVTVYALIGISVGMLGIRFDESAGFIPFVVWVRKAMGPLLLVSGLAMLGALPLHVPAGGALAGAVERIRPRGVITGPYALGFAFSFAFCPTLFWLFFGLTLPLAVSSGAAIGVPVSFALGTALPVLVLGTAVATGGASIGPVIASSRRFERGLSAAAGIAFLLLGFNEFVLYWLV